MHFPSLYRNPTFWRQVRVSPLVSRLPSRQLGRGDQPCCKTLSSKMRWHTLVGRGFQREWCMPKGRVCFLLFKPLTWICTLLVVSISCDTSPRQTSCKIVNTSYELTTDFAIYTWTKKRLRFYVACHSYTATYHISAILALGAHGYFEVTHDITRYCKAKLFESIGKKTPLFIRFSTVGECNNHKCTWVFSCD